MAEGEEETALDVTPVDADDRIGVANEKEARKRLKKVCRKLNILIAQGHSIKVCLDTVAPTA